LKTSRKKGKKRTKESRERGKKRSKGKKEKKTWLHVGQG
jgi:hypothetical protein